jgi:hypothetical protein
MTARLSVHAEIHDGIETRTVVIHGRDAWALQELVKAGPAGCTPIDHPGPRWSAYVHKLRKLGIPTSRQSTSATAHHSPAGTHDMSCGRLCVSSPPAYRRRPGG